MRTRNVVIGLVGAGIVAIVVWVVMVAVPTLTGELADTQDSGGRLPALPTLVASDLVWESGPGTIGSWVTTSAVFGTDGFIYALSTAPGVREIPFGVPIPHAVYRSQDGMTWSHELLADLGEDLFVRDLAQADAALYVVGTAPSAADPRGVAVRVGTSSDAGRTWASVDLPLDKSLVDEVGGVAGLTRVDVAANQVGGLVGTSNALANDINRSSVELFFGSTLMGIESISIPFAEGYGLERLAASEGEFYAVVRPNGGMVGLTLLELWRSANGQDWERLDNFPFMDMVSAFGEIGGRTAVIGQLEGSLVVSASLDGSAWDMVDLSELVPQVGRGGHWISAADIGPAGIYMTVQSFIPMGDSGREVIQLIESADLTNWSATPTGNLVQGYVDQMVVGDDFVFVNATSGLVDGRVHLIGTRG